ncbi:pyridoxamine 5'-phosphate oxidase family protein [Micromonospora purpureochromogenes]|uniref:pyridoxamine 5'-phosphate oxidase family protein n=1 Tax=Micromonospora TaxID=1873 RepID=UPI001B36C416|nr:pyridoxamine 5'-phosphate oxidase family protein [Micromonospora sp. U56]MBQ0895220.1 pyridoxamine 5'-phosphate oxidase family protein [Micromonospora sp. U56]
MASRNLRELSAEECLTLLGSVSLGRIVFTDKALPAIRPVNHILDDGSVIIRSHLGGGLASAVDSGRGVVVAYEADMIDPVERLGWSVVVTGFARLLADSREVARYGRALQPWVSMAMDCVIRIEPHIVVGYRLVDAGEAVSTQ